MMRESVSGMVPPHSGTQPALLPSRNARVNVFCPVACSTCSSVGEEAVMSMYGATFQFRPPGGEPVVPVGEALADADADGEAEWLALALAEGDGVALTDALADGEELAPAGPVNARSSA